MVAAVSFQHAVKSMTLMHEIGHLFSCEHDDMNTVKMPPLNKDYEYGFFVDHPASNTLHTIMA